MKGHKNLNWKYKKFLLIGIVIVYIIMGLIFYMRGSRLHESRVSDGGVVALLPGIPVAQKILGNDYLIREIVFPVENRNISDQAKLDVYLLKGGYDLENDSIEETLTFTANELKRNNSIRLAFPKTKLIYNRAYFIVFACSDSEWEKTGAIYLPTNSDWMEVYSEGSNYGVTFAYEADYFSHYNKAFFLWQILFIFGSLGAAFCFLTRKNFKEGICVVALLTMLGGYLFGVLDLLDWAYYVLLVLALIALIYVLYAIMTKSPEEIDKTFLSIRDGAAVWLALLILYLIGDLGKTVQQWDEMGHWATAVQNLYIFDSLPIHERSTVWALRYPPAYSIFQYLFLQIYGKSSVGIMHFAKHFFEMSMYMGCFSAIKKQKHYNILLIILCIGLPELFFLKKYLSSIYVDIAIGATLGLVLVRLSRLKTKYSLYNLFVLALAVMDFILIKENGLVFTLIICFSVMLCILGKKIIWNEQVEIRRCVVVIGVMAVSVLVGELSWNHYISLHTSYMVAGTVNSNTKDVVVANVVQASGINHNRLILFLMGKGASYQYSIIPAYIKRILFGNDYQTTILTFSIALWMLLLCIILYWGIHSLNNIVPNDSLLFSIIMCFGTVGAFLLLYIFAFPQRDLNNISSVERYIGSFLLGLSLYILSFLAYLQKKEKSIFISKLLTAVGVSILVLTDFCGCYREWCLKTQDYLHRVSDEMYEDAVMLRRYVCEKDRIYYISSTDGGLERLCNIYYLTPVRLSPGGNQQTAFYPTVSAPEEEREFQISPEEWRKQLTNYDYLYINHCSEEFRREYGVLFEEIDEVKSKTLYKIDEDTSIELEKFADVIN